jgi:hypothetical protein
MGFNGRTAADICSNWSAKDCVEVRPSAVLVIMLPQAEWLCGDAMMFTEIPSVLLALDLPEHPLINGFGFYFLLLSPEEVEAFRDEWYGERQCEPGTKEELAVVVEQLRQDLAAGRAAPQIQARYDAMLAIAASIQSPYFAR